MISLPSPLVPASSKLSSYSLLQLQQLSCYSWKKPEILGSFQWLSLCLECLILDTHLTPSLPFFVFLLKYHLPSPLSTLLPAKSPSLPLLFHQYILYNFTYLFYCLSLYSVNFMKSGIFVLFFTDIVPLLACSNSSIKFC